jgi:hypothetical protein
MMNPLISDTFFVGPGPYRSGAAPTTEASLLSIPYDGQTRMRLTITSGMSSARLRVDPGADALVAIHHDGSAPKLRVAGSEVRLSWSSSLADWWRQAFRADHGDAEIVLHPAVVWELVVRGGLSRLEGDLTAGTVARIEVAGGCSNVEIRVPKPMEAVPVRLSGGASHLRLSRPADVGVSLAVSGGIASLRLDEQTFDAIGGSARLESPGCVPGSPRYDIHVSGGASNIEVDGLV